MYIRNLRGDLRCLVTLRISVLMPGNICDKNLLDWRNKIADPEIDFVCYLRRISMFFIRVQEVRTDPASSVLAQVSSWQYWIFTEDSADIIAEAPHVICLPPTNIFLLLLLLSNSVFVAADILPKVAVENRKIEIPATKHARLSGTTFLLASDFQSIFSTDWLSIIRDFVWSKGTVAQFAESNKEIWGFLRSRLEIARRK